MAAAVVLDDHDEEDDTGPAAAAAAAADDDVDKDEPESIDTPRAARLNTTKPHRTGQILVASANEKKTDTKQNQKINHETMAIY